LSDVADSEVTVELLVVHCAFVYVRYLQTFIMLIFTFTECFKKLWWKS